MTFAAAIVAVGFGLLMGWGLGAPAYPRLPTTGSLLVGAMVGTLILAASYGPTPGLTGGSLLLGCASALVTLLLHRAAAAR